MSTNSANAAIRGKVLARINLLGGFETIVEGAASTEAVWRRRHAAALVKILALTPTRRMHREQLIDILWPEMSVDEAAPRLHKAAHYARRALGSPASVVLAGEAVALFPDADVLVDALAFSAEAEAALSTGDPEAAGAAADLYRGDLLPLDLYEPWAQDSRDRLRLMHLDVLRLARRWEVLTTVDPADERAHLELITLLAGRGDLRGALRQFERLERALGQELGVAPSRAAQAMRRQLLQRQAAAANSAAETEAVPGTIPADSVSGPVAPLDTVPELVGGVSQRERLTRLLAETTGGRGRTVFVGGPAGIGKTALLAWFERLCSERGIRVGGGVAARIEGAWPYAPVLEALADLSRRHPALLDGLDDGLRAEIERGLAGRELPWAADNGHQRLFVAAAELIRLAAAGAGAALIIDDAHEADDSSLRLLHYLARSTVMDRVLILIAHRPALTPALAHIRQSLLGRGTGVTLDMTNLVYDDVAELVRRHAPDATPEVVDAVWAASNGLPFTVVEMARAGGDGRTNPATLLPVAMPPSHVEALAGAAVLGMTFDTDEFVAVSGMCEDDAYAVLDTAMDHGLLVRTDTGYAFRHDLLRRAVLGQVTLTRHRTLHRRAAEALQGLDRSPARIGYQLVHSGNIAAAVPWMLRAAQTQAALGAYRDALDTLATIGAHAQGEDLARLLALRADLLMAGVDTDAVTAYRDALAVTIDPAQRSRLRARLARAASFAGDLETAAAALEGLRTNDSPDDAELLLARGILALFQGDIEAADAASSQARRRVALGGPEEWQWFELVGLQGLVAHTRGEWSNRLLLELRRGVRRPELAARIFDSHLCVAEFFLYGPTPYDEVLELANSLRETAERAGVLRAVAFATALRGETFLLKGDLAAAEAELQEAVDLHRDIDSTAGEAHSLQRLAEVKLALGDRAEANRLLYRALPLARLSSIAVHLIQRVYGTMIAAAADPQTARAMVDRADAAMGFDDHCNFCSIMLAVPAVIACAAVGDIDDAQGHLAVAEKSATMWKGTAWQAAVLEARGHLLAAQGSTIDARRRLIEAEQLFEAVGQPRDAARCRASADSIVVIIADDNELTGGSRRADLP